jgi:hypothetical protein
MVVVQDGPQQENEKPLRIYGDPQKVEHAKQLVYDLIAEKEMEVSVSLVISSLVFVYGSPMFNHKFQTSI